MQGTEYHLELTYQTQVTPWMVVQPEGGIPRADIIKNPRQMPWNRAHQAMPPPALSRPLRQDRVCSIHGLCRHMAQPADISQNTSAAATGFRNMLFKANSFPQGC